MINYYEILGLGTNAGTLEIKNAFRRLAKLYHPDKNPNGKEHFTKILKAYEILSDPVQKSTYDYRLKYQASVSGDYEPKKASTKNWSFDEKELKRRQYYNDFIKKQTKEAEDFQAAQNEKRTYSDYKYIFFATPLAVALFLSIMKLATPYKSMPRNTPAPLSASASGKTVTAPGNGESVYGLFFGAAQYDSIQPRDLSLVNTTNNDMVICLFSKTGFVRSAYLSKGDSICVGHLPAVPVTVMYCSGSNFDPEKKIENTALSGIFTSQLHFYRSLKPVKLKLTKKLSLNENTGTFAEISAEEFFSKQ